MGFIYFESIFDHLETVLCVRGGVDLDGSPWTGRPGRVDLDGSTWTGRQPITVYSIRYMLCKTTFCSDLPIFWMMYLPNTSSLR